jgi:hypothetical protein
MRVCTSSNPQILIHHTVSGSAEIDKPRVLQPAKHVKLTQLQEEPNGKLKAAATTMNVRIRRPTTGTWSGSSLRSYTTYVL